MAGVYTSGFWGNDGATGTRMTPITQRNRIKRVVNRDQFRAATELFDTLIGATAGGTALATHKRVGHTLSNGTNEASTVVTVTDINRVSTAADVAALKEMVFGVSARPATYPRDLSGNGGPAF